MDPSKKRQKIVFAETKHLDTNCQPVRGFEIALGPALHLLRQQENFCGILAVRDEPVLQWRLREYRDFAGWKYQRDSHADHAPL